MVNKILPLLLLLSLLLTGFISLEIIVNEDMDREGDLISVAQYLNDQDDPKAAYSSASGQYLVVFEDPGNQGDILGQYLDGENGELIGGWFHIASSSEKEFHADVVYDEFHDRFLVVWHREYCQGIWCYFIVEGMLLYGSYQEGDYWAGNVFQIANGSKPDNTGLDMVNPAAAYNDDERQYIVVYQKGKFSTGDFPSLYGQIIRSGASNPEVLTGVFTGFEISAPGSLLPALFPDVAWSREGENFLVVWRQRWPSETDRILARYVYDTYQGVGGKQVYGNGEVVVAPSGSMGSDPDVDNYKEHSVAFDVDGNHYLVAFAHLEKDGPKTLSRIYAQQLKNTYDTSSPLAGDTIPVDSTIEANYAGHSEPEMEYSVTGDAVLLTYVSTYYDKVDYLARVNARLVRGGAVGERLFVRTAPKESLIIDLDLAVSKDGQALVVWEEKYEFDPHDWDIHAQRVRVFSKVYLPVIIVK